MAYGEPVRPACATCHKAQAQTQPHTDMGRALQLPGSNTVLQEHPQLRFRQGAYSYQIETREGRSTYSVTDGSQTISVPVQWAFGARSQTYVLEYGGKLYESLVSFYPGAKGLDVTIGDGQLRPRTVLEAFGRELAETETRACFGCHATGALPSGQPLRLNSLTAGVQCGHCHAGAEVHRQAVTSGKGVAAAVPAKLGKLSPEETSNFCGQCHRTWDRVMRDRIRGEVNVRFQPYRLANSKCYDGADARLSCTSCHDPHRDVTRGATAYDAKCLACHASSAVAGRVEVRVAAPIAKACPKATSECTTCHMPKVELPGAHMVFTDHQIRVVRSGEPYPN